MRKNMLKLKKKGVLIVISGPTSVGKDTIFNHVLKTEKNIYGSVSVTTREKKPKETEGVEYYFVDIDTFEKRIKNDEFIEYATVHGNYYGTPKKELVDNLNSGKDVMIVIDIQGAMKIKEIVTDALFIFILPPSMEELKTRFIARGRGESKEEMAGRFKTAYKEINEISKYNYVVVNDKLPTAVKKVKAIILAEKSRVDRIEDLDLDTIEELMHETIVK